MPHDSQVEMAQLRLIKSAFSVNTDYQTSDERISIAVSLKNNGEFLDDGRRAHFIQRIMTGDRAVAPFYLDVEYGALFFLDPPPLPLEWTHYVRKVFPQMVFPYLREYVAETTRRGGFTPLILSPGLFEDTPETDPAPTVAESKWVH